MLLKTFDTNAFLQFRRKSKKTGVICSKLSQSINFPTFSNIFQHSLGCQKCQDTQLNKGLQRNLLYSITLATMTTFTAVLRHSKSPQIVYFCLVSNVRFCQVLNNFNNLTNYITKVSIC